MKPRIFFRVDAGPRIGWGHVQRCIALAEEAAKRGHKPEFWMKTSDPAALRFVRARFPVRRLKQELGKGHPPTPPAGSWLVMDLNHPSPSLARAARRAQLRVLRIDDYGKGACDADIILNQNPPAQRRWYSEGSASQFLLGVRYCLLRPVFRTPVRRTVRRRARRVLICFGGSDVLGLTGIVAHSLPSLVEREIVVGPSARSPRSLKARGPVTAEQMRKLMMWADVAVLAMGTICWEAARLGLPTLVLATSRSHRLLADDMVRRGVVAYLRKPYGRSALLLLQNHAARVKMSRRGRRLIDGKGTDRGEVGDG